MGDAQNSPEAFREFYRRHEAIVVAFLARRTPDREAVADITAETFAAAYRQRRRYRAEGASAVGWLIAIAHNILRRSLRSAQIEQRARRRLGVGPLAVSDASLERVERLADLQDADNPLMVALRDLPPAQRTAVLNHIVNELSYEEMAAALRVSPATVRKRVSRGLARMRIKLEGKEL